MEFELNTTIDAPIERVFNAWLSSKEHTNMTGGEAKCSTKPGGSFEAWDGYISGKNIEIDDQKKIIQTWRTTEFADDEDDSLVELNFTDLDGRTEIHMKHSNLPAHGERYIDGWKDHYFAPMKDYFKS
jgi:activator of HSP90 ATPase